MYVCMSAKVIICVFKEFILAGGIFFSFQKYVFLKKFQQKNSKKKKFPPAKINSLNTEIMTFADIHTYIHTHSSYPNS